LGYPAILTGYPIIPIDYFVILPNYPTNIVISSDYPIIPLDYPRII
jgi:hypothetical protein